MKSIVDDWFFINILADVSHVLDVLLRQAFEPPLITGERHSSYCLLRLAILLGSFLR
jgi:hypothetical protein